METVKFEILKEILIHILMVSISLQISGPLLPKPLEFHSMVRLGKGQAILGGWSNGDYQAKIYSMGCSDRNCIISLLNRELSVPQGDFMAISIPDTISGCITEGKQHFQKKRSLQPNILNYRLPIPTSDWGRFLP